MHTIQTTAVVTPEHTVTVTLPPDVAPGECDIVVVIGDARRTPNRSLFAGMKALDLILVDPDNTFRREDMYGDDGR